MAEKNCFDITKLIFHCGAVVMELLAPTDELGLTPGEAISVSLYRFFCFC